MKNGWIQMVEARGVEPLSKSIATWLSPSAVSDLLFRSSGAHGQATVLLSQKNFPVSPPGVRLQVSRIVAP